MLYVGIVVLEDVVPDAFYQNYLCFCLAMRILLSKNQHENLESAQLLLNTFVKNSMSLYGKSFMSYNVHSLLHLVDDYKKWGSLDEVSCFCFESYLGTIIKGRLSGRNKPLEQICRHVSLENNNPSSVIKPNRMQKIN